MSGAEEISPAHRVFSVRIRKVTSRAEVVTRYVSLLRGSDLLADLRHAERIALENQDVLDEITNYVEEDIVVTEVEESHLVPRYSHEVTVSLPFGYQGYSVEILETQIEALLNSDMEESCKEGLHSLLESILDHALATKKPPLED